jgi:hypothetical protein
VSHQVSLHKLPERLQLLHESLEDTPGFLSAQDADILNDIDQKFTDILLAGEKQCARQPTQCQPWSPFQRKTAQSFSYWKQKFSMSKKKCFHWEHLDRLQKFTKISGCDHSIRDYEIIQAKLQRARSDWKACKKKECFNSQSFP